MSENLKYFSTAGINHSIIFLIHKKFYRKEKIFAGLIAVIMISQRAFAEEVYDTQHTMLPLNMVVVSVRRILTTESRAVLEAVPEAAGRNLITKTQRE